MKILKIELENINSLFGKWCIDFTDPSFVNNSLFSISGPTGSGKSSILDAITLALYGRTPRQDTIHKGGNGNEVMTRDAGYCLARVTYHCSKGDFVSEWSQRRARDKASGNLQDAQGIVYRVGEETAPIFNAKTTSKGELAEVNTENTQLDFSQFCRSIMLAQGEFSKFLTCEEKERAEILEKLNGSEKYRLIGEKVGDHWSTAKADKEAVEAQLKENENVVLSDEEKHSLQIEKEILEKEGKLLATEKKKTDEIIAWYKKLNEKIAALNNAKGARERAEKACSEFKNDDARLQKAVAASECSAPFATLEGLRTSKANIEKEIDKNRNSLPGLETSLTYANEQKSDAEKTQKQACDFIQNNEMLWNEVRTLDTQIKSSVDNLTQAETRKKNAEQNLTDANANLERAQGDVEKFQKIFDDTDAFLKEHAADRDLPQVISKSESVVKQLNDNNRELKNQKDALTVAQKDVENSVENLNMANSQKQKLLQEQNELFQNEVLVLADVIQKHLQPNAPCPVCGSTEHPACSGERSENSAHAADSVHTNVADSANAATAAADTAAKIRDLNERLQAADKRIATFETAKVRAESAVKAASEAIKNATDHRDEAIDTLAAAWKPWVAFDIEKIDATLELLRTRSCAYQGNKEMFDSVSGKLNAAKVKKEAAETGAKAAAGTAQTETGAYDSALDVKNQLVENRNRKFGDQNVEDVVSHAKNTLDTANANLQKCVDSVHAAQAKLDNCKTQIATFQSQLESVQKDLAKAQADFSTALQKNNFESEEAFAKARLTQNELHQLQTRKQEIENALVAARQSESDAAFALENVKSERSETRQLEDLQALSQRQEDELGIKRERFAGIRAMLQQDQNNSERRLKLQQEFDEKNREFIRWDTMRDWFGKKDGTEFSQFVQGLTFKSLLKHANRQLQIVRERYTLEPKGNLDFSLRDAHFDYPRAISNLSGGEKFLISLSLALGIADFASRNVKIESLFIDEGFGTLDPASLNDVMDCLKAQQKRGKMLGFISHVDNMIHEIPQKIELEIKSNGHSVIHGPGVTGN